MDVWFCVFFCINWLAYTKRACRDRPVTALTRVGLQHGRQAHRPINKNIFQLVLGRCLCNTFSIRAWNGFKKRNLRLVPLCRPLGRSPQEEGFFLSLHQ